MAHPSKAEWLEVDEDNEEHLAGHGVTAAELFEVFENDPLWASNKKGRTGAWLMVGWTAGRSPVVAVVVYDEIRACVRPITARRCEPNEVAKWLR